MKRTRNVERKTKGVQLTHLETYKPIRKLVQNLTANKNCEFTVCEKTLGFNDFPKTLLLAKLQ